MYIYKYIYILPIIYYILPVTYCLLIAYWLPAEAYFQLEAEAKASADARLPQHHPPGTMAPKICAGKADAATSPPEPKAAPKAMKVPVFSKAAADLGGYTFEQAAAAEAKEYI